MYSAIRAFRSGLATGRSSYQGTAERTPCRQPDPSLRERVIGIRWRERVDKPGLLRDCDKGADQCVQAVIRLDQTVPMADEIDVSNGRQAVDDTDPLRPSLMAFVAAIRQSPPMKSGSGVDLEDAV